MTLIHDITNYSIKLVILLNATSKNNKIYLKNKHETKVKAEASWSRRKKCLLPVPDLPGLFSLVDQHVIAVHCTGTAVSTHLHKLGNDRIVDQVEQQVVGG